MAHAEPGAPRPVAGPAWDAGVADLPDVVRRIGRYWWLIALLVVAGIVAGLARDGERMYTATARVVLDTPDPATRQQAVAIADTVKAIATSTTQVRSALFRAGVQRDPTEVARHRVNATGVGSSAIVRLSVSDADPGAAASIANALASQVIFARERVTRGASEQQLAELDAGIDRLGSQMARVDEVLAATDADIAAATTAATARRLRAKQEATSRQRDVLAQQRGVLESERVTILASFATRPKPAVISTAAAPTTADSSGRLQYMILGGLLGLILGVAFAAVLEMVRPTIVGGEALAAELGVPLLATIGRLGAPPAQDLSRAAGRIQLAADTAGVAKIELIAWPPGERSHALCDGLRRSTAELGLEAASSGAETWAVAAARAARAQGQPLGVVLLAPSALKRRDVAEIDELLALRRFPLLGLVVAKRSGAIRRTLARVFGVAHKHERRVTAEARLYGGTVAERRGEDGEASRPDGEQPHLERRANVVDQPWRQSARSTLPAPPPGDRGR